MLLLSCRQAAAGSVDGSGDGSATSDAKATSPLLGTYSSTFPGSMTGYQTSQGPTLCICTQILLESQVDSCHQVQRVGVMDSPSVGSPNALIGVTSYTSNGAPPEVGAP